MRNRKHKLGQSQPYAQKQTGKRPSSTGDYHDHCHHEHGETDEPHPHLNISEMGFGLLVNLSLEYGADLPTKICVLGLQEVFDFSAFYRHLCKSHDFAAFYTRLPREGVFAAIRYDTHPAHDGIANVNVLTQPRYFTFPDFSNIPATPPKNCTKAFTTLIASMSSSSPSRPKPIPYYVGPGLTPDFDTLLTAGKLSRLGRLEGVTTPYWHLGEKNSGTHFHFEDAAVRSYNLTIAGYKLWILIRTQSTDAFEELVAQEFSPEGVVDALQPPRCDQWLRHLQVLIPPEMLAQHGIQYDLVVAGPGDLVLTAPRQYHAVLNLTACLAISVNFTLPTEPVLGPTTVCKDCGLFYLKHPAVKKISKRLSGSRKRATHGEEGTDGGRLKKRRWKKEPVKQSNASSFGQSQRQKASSRPRILSLELQDHTSPSVELDRSQHASDEEEKNDGNVSDASSADLDEDNHASLELRSASARSGNGPVSEDAVASSSDSDLDFLNDPWTINLPFLKASGSHGVRKDDMIIENPIPMTHHNGERSSTALENSNVAAVTRSDRGSSSHPEMLASKPMAQQSPSLLLKALAADSNVSTAPEKQVVVTRLEEFSSDEVPSPWPNAHQPSSPHPTVDATTGLPQVLATIAELEQIDRLCAIPVYDTLEPPSARVLKLAAVVRSRFAIKQFCDLVALRRSVDAFDVWAAAATITTTTTTTIREEDNGQKNLDVIRRAKFLKALDTNKAIKHIIQYFFAINIDNARNGLEKINPALKKRIQDAAGLTNSQYNDYLQKGNKWKKLCGGDADTYGGILCFIPATKGNPFKVSPTDYLAMVDREGEVQEFHSMLGVGKEDDEYTSEILRAGKAFQAMFSGTATDDVCFHWEIHREELGEGVGNSVPVHCVESQENMLALLQPVSWLGEDIYDESNFHDGGPDPTRVRKPPSVCVCESTWAEPPGDNSSCSCYQYPQGKTTAAMIRIKEYPNSADRLSLQAASEQPGAIVFKTNSMIGYLTGRLVQHCQQPPLRMVIDFGDLCQLDCREEGNHFRLMGHACQRHANAQIAVLSPLWVSGRYRIAVFAMKNIVNGQEITATWPSATEEETKLCRLCVEEQQVKVA